VKLAYFALVLGLGTGACVADDPTTTGRLGDEATDFAVANQVEIPKDEGVNGDFQLVVLTGIEIPGRAPTTDHIDITNVTTAEIDPQVRELCLQADQLPSSDVCSQICSSGFTAKVFDQGAPGGCKTQRCGLPGDITVNLDICVGE